ncbi:MAG: hypothetical protein D8M58_19170 [Calditrichaeota bacterium]|nr:MAG: hypothetical protein DWQ03_21850 [Calditrichota bacterium]MBL1207533.1 hypothetical protein [Calditrichota bacterium]NOG47365.1 hypothetical protein [Calditrichota bacterium]
MKTLISWFFAVLAFSIIFSTNFSQAAIKQETPPNKAVSGFLTPMGKPLKKPIRIDAGESCIIELIQSYSISGDISGSVEMNYRIIVYGKCGSPIGTYNEEWIAYGNFIGAHEGKKVQSKLSYTAKVKAGGDVNGIISFGQGFRAKITINGNFSDGRLSYNGEAY